MRSAVTFALVLLLVAGAPSLAYAQQIQHPQTVFDVIKAATTAAVWNPATGRWVTAVLTSDGWVIVAGVVVLAGAGIWAYNKYRADHAVPGSWSTYNEVLGPRHFRIYCVNEGSYGGRWSVDATHRSYPPPSPTPAPGGPIDGFLVYGPAWAGCRGQDVDAVASTVAQRYSWWSQLMQYDGYTPGGGPQSGPAVWPGTQVALPATIGEAVQDSRWPTLAPLLAPNLPAAVAATYPSAPVRFEDYPPAVVFPAPYPYPDVRPTPAPMPTFGNPPDVGNPPVPENPAAEPTQSYMQALFAWLAAAYGSWTQWLAGQFVTVITWLRGEYGKDIEWLSNTIAGPLSAVTTAVQGVAATVETFPAQLAEVKAAVEAIPGQMADAIETGISDGVQAAFVPQAQTITQFQGLTAVVMTKPPFSLLPPAAVFPTLAPGECSLPDIQLTLMGRSAMMEWPSFVCEYAALFRTFLLGLFWVSIGLFVMGKIWPSVHI